MNLFQNPFFIIGVSTRDSKQTIVEACDAKSLTVDSDLCTRFRSVLTQPRNRLSAELAWLPGLSPARALGLIERLEKDPKNFLLLAEVLNPLCKCNAMATYLEYCKPKDESLIINVLMALAQSFELIDFANLMAVINEDRKIVGIPLIQDVEGIKHEMQNRREHIIGIMKDSLNNVKAPDNVLTEIITKTTADGKLHPPILIEELTDKYQIEVQKYLDQLVGQIRNIISDIEKQPKKMFEYQMPYLYKYLKTWDQIAQPIQLIQQSKGLDDAHSKELAHDMRGLALELANEHEMHLEAKQITEIISEIFKELPQFADKFSEDLMALENIIARKTKSEEEDKEWREERSLDIDLGGTFFKKRFIISPEVIKFKDAQIVTNKVTRVRWNSTITQHSVNFIPTGTSHSYSIWVGNDQTMFHLTPTVENMYHTIISKLWKAVCVRLITDTLEKLSSGEYINFGNGAAIVNKDGIMLKNHKLFRQEPYFTKWEDLRIGNGNGTFGIWSDREKKANAEFSYENTNNAHIIESVVRLLLKDGNYQKLRTGEFK